MDVTAAQDWIRFEPGAVDAFRRLSHDANPLHGDAAYARRTPFGTPVVHGMLGALAALRTLLRGGTIRLRTLRGKFPGPLFPETGYHVTREDLPDGAAALRLLGGTAAKVELTVGLEPSGPHAPLTGGPQAPVHQAQAPAPAELAGLRLTGEYHVDGAAAAALDAMLGLGLANLPAGQLQALAWVSYCCGMLVPGRQSLIGDVQLTFAEGDSGAGPLAYDVRVERFDARFGALHLRASLRAGGQPLADVAITAFSRPEPVTFSVDALRESVTASDGLRGRVALVTGGTRGLGAYLVGALGLQGAEVFVNYRSDPADAETLADALRPLGIRVHGAPADVTDPAACAGLARLVEDRTGRLDLLVNNASPPILARTFDEQEGGALAAFVALSLQATVLPTRALLPLLRRGGGIVATISSEYAATAPAKFSHYVAAKLAAEGVMATLAHEETAVRCVVVRPPRLLTDQTNTNIDLGVRLHPAKAAAWIAASLHQLPEQARFLLLDQLKPPGRSG